MGHGSDLTALARRVSYVGSPEHKRVPNPFAVPNFVTGKSDCDEVAPELSRDPMFVLHVLQEALRRGQISGPWEGDFPRNVHGWLVTAGKRVLFRGRLTNREQGVYKGYFDSLDRVPAPAQTRLRDGGEWAEEVA